MTTIFDTIRERLEALEPVPIKVRTFIAYEDVTQLNIIDRNDALAIIAEVEAAHPGLVDVDSPTRLLERVKALIPPGDYCYTYNGKDTTGADGMPRHGIDRCPFWSIDESHEEQVNGYCAFLENGDWMGPGLGLLWDQCKACGINGDDEDVQP